MIPLAAGAQTQGVSKTEIVVGSIQDLSGPIAALGTHFRNGLQMRFDEANAKGGVHGRKITLIVEDSGYDPKKAVLAAQKLIQRDKVFAAINTLGSPVVMATMPLFLERDILHVFPAAPIPPTYEPAHKYKFANLPRIRSPRRSASNTWYRRTASRKSASSIRTTTMAPTC